MSATALPPPAAPLVGRDRELLALRDRVDRTLSGRGGLVAISGEAGIGKTALAEAACRQATERGALVAVGRCYDLTETPPYGPWIELFARFPAAPGTQPPAIFGTPGSIDTATSRAALFAEVSAFLTARSAERPLLLLLEDLHWADAASLDLLRLVARDATEHPLLVLVSYRDDELPRRNPLRQALPLLERDASPTRLTLRGLSPDTVTTLVTSRYGLNAGDAGRLATFLHERTDGNAFYVVQALRTLEEESILRPEGSGWAVDDLRRVKTPASVLQVVDMRVQRLDESAQALLSLAAILGPTVPLDRWATVAGMTEDELLPAVEAGTAARLIDATPDGFGIRFVHDLTREAIYEAILPLRRRLLHRQVGRALAGLPHPDPDEVASHLRRAGDPEAVDWLIAAGDRAERAYAMATAVDRLEAALSLLDAAGGAPERRARLKLRVALLLRFQDPRGGAALLDEAERLAHDAADPGLAAKVVLLRGMLRCHANHLADGLADLRAGATAIEAMGPEDAPVGDDEPYAAYLNRGVLAMWLALTGSFAEASALADRCLAAAAAVAGDRARATRTAAAWAAVSLAQAALGDIDRARRAEAQALAATDVLRRHRHLVPSANSVYTLAALTYVADDPAERGRLMAEADRVGRRNVSAQPFVDERLLGRTSGLPLLFAMGRWDEALEIAAGVENAYGEQFVAGVGRDVVGAIAFARGESPAAWQEVRRVWPAGPATEPGPRHVLPAMGVLRLAAALALDARDLPSACAWLEAHDRWLAWTGAAIGRSEGHALWAAYHAAAGERDRAGGHADAALTEAATPRRPLALLAARRHLARLAIANGTYDEARVHLRAATELAHACVARYEGALTSLVEAELYLAAGIPGEAETALDSVRAVCEPLDAWWVLRQAQAIADRLLEHSAAVAAYPSGLSPREVEILRLLATGLTNREIADTLSLSIRTVERHIFNAYGKIGAHGRAAATAYALRHLS